MSWKVSGNNTKITKYYYDRNPQFSFQKKPRPQGTNTIQQLSSAAMLLTSGMMQKASDNGVQVQVIKE